MIALYILSALALLLALILMVPGKITVEYKDDVRVAVFVSGFRIWSHPKPKKKIRLSDYTPEAIEKRKRREQKKQERLQAKKQKKQQKKKSETSTSGKPKKKRGLLDNLNLIQNIASAILGKTAKHIRIEIRRFIITVGTDDAAKTAILFGAVNQASAALLEFLHQTGTAKYTANTRVSVNADFAAQKSTADIYLSFSLRLWQLLNILFSAALRFVKAKHRTSKTSESNTNVSIKSN